MPCQCGCNATAVATPELAFIAQPLSQVHCGCGCGGACGCGSGAVSDRGLQVRLEADEQPAEPGVAELKPTIV